MAVVNPLDEPVTSLLIFGSQLIALSEDGGRLLIWDTNDGSEATRAPTTRTHLTSFTSQLSSRRSNSSQVSPPYQSSTPRRT
jgi:hypothetical protein